MQFLSYSVSIMMMKKKKEKRKEEEKEEKESTFPVFSALLLLTDRPSLWTG